MAADAASMEGFVRAHSRSLFGTAYLLTGDAASAEDLVQETLASLAPKWALVTQADSAVAYVRRALTNRFVSSRRGRLASLVLLEELPERAAPGDHAQTVADRDQLFRLLVSLPARQRAAVVLATCTARTTRPSPTRWGAAR